MKHLLGAMAVLLVTGATLTAQSLTRVYTRPQVPPEAVLNRLNLQLAWRTFVPSGGERDGIANIQVLADMVLVQMRSGLLTALDPETGRTRWRTHVGLPYRPLTAPGHNTRSVFVFSGARLFVLDRRTGAAQWDFDPPSYPTAAPAADNERIYQTNAQGHLMVFGLPQATPSSRPGAEAVARPEATAPTSPGLTENYGKSTQAAAGLGPLSSLGRGKSGVQEMAMQSLLLWDFRVESSRLEQTPILYGNLLAAADSGGVFFILTKDTHQERFSLATGSEVAAPLGQHGKVAYVATRNFNLFALDIEAAQILWRFTADRPIRRQPIVTDDEVYLAPEKGGLFRIDRLTGKDIWRNPSAEQFLAENKALVYALDANGWLLLLDRVRGDVLASFDVHNYVVPVANGLTDRVYLASNDGQIVALHDRGYAKPWRAKTVAEEKIPTPAKPEGKAEEKVPVPAKPEGKAEEKVPAPAKPAGKPAEEKMDKKPGAEKGNEKKMEK